MFCKLSKNKLNKKVLIGFIILAISVISVSCYYVSKLYFFNEKVAEIAAEPAVIKSSNTINGVTIEMEIAGDNVFDDRATIGKVVTVTAYFPEQQTGNKSLTLEVPEGLEYDVNGVPVPTDYVNPGTVQENILNVLGEGQPLAQQAINTVSLPAMDTVTESTFGSVTYVLNETADKIILTFYVKADEDRVYGTHDILGHLTARASFNDTQVSTYTDVTATGSDIAGSGAFHREHEFASDVVVSSTDTETLYNYSYSSFRPEYLPYVIEGSLTTYYPVGMEYVTLVTYNTVTSNAEYPSLGVVDVPELGKVTYTVENDMFYSGSTAKYKIPVGIEEGIYSTTGVPVIEFTTFDGVKHKYYPGNSDMDGDGNIDEGYVYSTEEVVSRESFGAPLKFETRNSTHDLHNNNYSNTGFVMFSNENPFQTENIMYHVEIDPNYLAKVVRLPRGTGAGLVQYKTTKNDEWQTYTFSSIYYLHLDADDIGLDADEYITEVLGNIGKYSANKQSFAYSSINYHTTNVAYGIQKPGVTEVSHNISAWIEGDKENTLVTLQTHNDIGESLVNMTTDGRSVAYKDGVEVTAITAGDTLHVESTASIQGYLYGNSFIIEDPYFILREVNGITIHPSTIELKNDLTGENLDFNIDYIVSEDGSQENYYKITLLENMTMGFLVGYPINEVNITTSYDFTTNSISTESYVFNVASVFAFLQDGATGRSYISGNNNFERGLDLNNNGTTTDILPSTASLNITVNKNNHVIVDTYLSLNDGTRYPAYMPAYPETGVNFTPGLSTNYNISIQNLSAYNAKDFVLYFPIPKIGDYFGENYQTEAFSYNMKLTDYLADMPGFTIEYGTGITESTITTGNYTETPADLSKVNMIRVVGDSLIGQGENIEVVVPLEIDETLESSTGKIGTMNIFNPYYTVDYTVYAGWKKGSSVGAKLVLMNIEGDLFKDVNFNGIKDLEDTPLSNVNIELYRKQLDGTYLPVLDGSSTKTVTTDENGHYQFIHQDMFDIAEYMIKPIIDSSLNLVETNYQAVANYEIDSDMQIGASSVFNIDPTLDEASFINIGYIDKQNLVVDNPSLIVMSPRENEQFLLVDTETDASGLISPYYFDLLGGVYNISANKNVVEYHTFVSGNEFLSLTAADISTTELLDTDLLFNLTDRYGNVTTSKSKILVMGEDRIYSEGLSALNTVIPNKIAQVMTLEEFLKYVDAEAFSNIDGSKLDIAVDNLAELNAVPYQGGNYDVVLTTSESSITINVEIGERLKTDASLAGITVDGILLDNFFPETKIYNLTVPYLTTSINLNATATDVDAGIDASDLGVKNLNLGNTTFNINVTAEDADFTDIYTLYVERLRHTDNSLNNLTVLDTLATWSSDENAYLVNVASDVDNILSADIVGDVHETATLITGSGVSLEYGKNEYNISVTAHDGTIANYKILINRLYKTDATLSDLTINDVTLTDFSSSKHSYELTVPYSTENITVGASLTDEDALINSSDLGTKNLNVGVNTINVNVTAHDGKTKLIYSVNITREENNDNSLNGLKIAGVDATWNVDANRYEVILPSNITLINSSQLIGTVDETATFISGEGLNLSYGDNEYSVTVRAQNNDVKIYDVLIFRSYKTDATLSDLTINDVTLSDFDSSKNSYDLTLSYSTNIVNIGAILNDLDATITNADLGEKSLVVGLNTFTINVTAHDGVTKQVYTLNITREENNNNELLSLNILGNAAIYNASLDQYEVAVPSNILSFSASDILGTVDETATFIPGIGMELEYGENDYVVIVTSQKGITKTYDVVITRLHKTDAKLSDITIDGNSLENFDSNTYVYNLTVPYTTDELVIGATTIDVEAFVTSADLGTKSLSVGNNTFNINVTAHDSLTKLVYTINVIREENNDNTLNGLTILENNAIWNVEENRFEVTLEAQIDSLLSSNISGLVHETALFNSGDGLELDYGINNYSVYVTAQNGTLKTYDVAIFRSYKTDATLSSIKIDEDLISGFSSSTYLYNLTVPYSKSEVELFAVSKDIDANITAADLGTKNLNVGNNLFEINVTAHDGVSTEKYQVNIIREENNNNDLSSLNIFGEEVIFNSETNKYEIILNSNISEIKPNNILGVVHETATFNSGVGLDLTYGENTYGVSVTAQNGTIKTYDILIVRSFKSDASLSNITIDENNLENFDSNTYIYNLTVPYTTDELVIGATTTDVDATVTSADLGTKNLSVGNNTFNINVTAHDSSTKLVYTINVTREENNDNNLTTLTILGTDAIWDSENNRFEVTLSHENDSLVSTDFSYLIDSTASFSVADEMSLNYGVNNKSVSVTAQNGNVKTYDILIYRNYKTEASLSNITIDGSNLENFDSSVYSYNLTVPYTTDELVIGATTIDVDATVTSADLGNKSLSVGNNTFNINVTAHDSLTKLVYTINVTREENNDNNLTSLTILGTDATYNASLDQFKVEVPSNTLSFSASDISGIVDETATFIPGIGMDLEYGENDYVVIVTSQKGVTKTYDVVITRLHKTDAKLSDITIDGNSLENFDSNTFVYNLTVPYTTNELVIGATTIDVDAFVTSADLGTKSLSVGNNTFNINVTAHDSLTKLVYTINVIREENDDNNLNGLTILGTDAIWDSEDNRFEVTLSHENDSLVSTDFSYLIDSTASFGVADEISLNYGVNNKSVSVTAQNGNVKTYDILIYRNYKTNNNLSGILIDNNILNDFSVDKLTYDIIVPYNKTNISLNATLEDIDASLNFSELGNKDLIVGLNTFNITVTAHDGVSIKSYVINIVREENDNSNVTNLLVHDSLATWNSVNNRYEVVLGSDITNVSASDVDVSIHETATITKGSDVTLDYGENTYTFDVTAQNGNKKSYEVMIYRSYKTNALLSSITIDSLLINDFVSNTFTYDITLDNEISEINLNATLSDTDASITSSTFGKHSLNVGLNTLKINVTAHDGVTTSEYTVNITRKASSNTGVKQITILGNIAEWNNDLNKYVLQLNSSYDNFVVSDVQIDLESLTSSINAFEGMSLNYGENNFNFTVVAEDKTSQSYEVLINRLYKTDATLSSITIDDLLVSGFDFMKNTYDITLPYNTTNITINGITTDVDATILSSDLGNKNLDLGLNTFTINVTAHDSSTSNVYTLNITREKNTNNELTSLTILNNEATWNDEETRFEVNVSSSDEVFTSLDIAASVHETAIINVGSGMNLVYGENNYQINVTAQNGNIKIYNVVINRPFKNDVTIASLFANDKEILTYDEATSTYSYTVGYSTDTVDLSLNLTDVDATVVSGLGIKNLNLGNNIFEISVLAHDKITTKTYHVSIDRLEVDNELLTAKAGSNQVIGEKYISTVSPNTTVLQFKNMLENDNENLYVYSADGITLLSDDSFIETGMIIKLIKSDIEMDQKTLIVKGDVSGGGGVNLSDVMIVVNIYLGKTTVSEIFEIAADLNNNGSVDLADAMILVNFYLRKTEL